MTELTPGQITVGDVYRELVGMRADITRALERIAVIDNRNTSADQIHLDHETRLRTLETAMPDNVQARLSGLEGFRAKLLGVAIACSFGSGALGTVIGWLLTRK